MVQSRTMISGYLRISLVLVLILVGSKPIFAQQKDLNTFLQYFDAETAIPEEDVTLLNEILKGQWPAGKILAEQILKLSIIEYEDEVLLRKVRGTKTFFNVAEKDDASPFLRELIKTISATETRLAEMGDVMVNQYMVFGDDNRYRWNINYNRNKYSFGVIAERDPREAKLLDHLSGYFLRRGKSDELIIGDYQIVSGFGLWSWRSVSTRKSFESISGLPRLGSGTLPYRSSNEYWYIRGINYNKNTKIGNFSISGGMTKQDGRFDDDGNVYISSSGLHTGGSSIEQENNITESLLIGRWNHSINNSNIVASIVGSNWKDDADMSKNDWSGSVAVNQLINSGSLFGEIGRGYDDTYGSIAGMRLKFPNIMYLVSTRYYSKGYSALRANPFAEWVGNDRNEFGLYQGINFKHDRQNFIIYGDIFRTAEIEGNESFPTVGQEAGIRWEWRKGREYQRIQWKWEKNTLEDDVIYLLEAPETKEIGNTIKYSGVHEIKDSFWGKLQLTYSNETVANDNSNAFGIDTQVWYELKNWNIYFDLVTTFTNAGSAWIYFWDVNLPGEMTTRVYTKDTISPAIKLLYQTDNGFELGFRVRAQWQEFDFKGTPDLYSALVLEVLL